MAKRMGPIAQCRTACGRVPATDPKAPNRLEIARFRADRHPRPHRAQATRIASARLLPRYPHRLHHAGGAERPAGAFPRLYRGTILELPHFGEDENVLFRRYLGPEIAQMATAAPRGVCGHPGRPPAPLNTVQRELVQSSSLQRYADVHQLFLITTPN